MRYARTHLLAAAAAMLALTLTGCELPFGLGDLDSILSPTSYDEAYIARSTQTAPAVTPPAILKEGTLTVGLRSNAIAPLSIIGEGNSAMGIDVDLASALAGELGLKVAFTSVSDPAEALGKSCDIVMSAQASDDGSTTIVGSYAETAAALFRKGDGGIIDFSELDGKTVALQEGSVSQQALRATAALVTEQPYASLNEAFAALDEGRVDFVLCEAYPGAYLAASFGGISLVGTLDVPASTGIAVAPDNAALQAAVQSALESVRGNGAMDLIRSKWIGGATPITSTDVIANIVYAEQESAAEDVSFATEGGETADADGGE